jgi:ADP-ribose pyrophosphatase YjhB (NUDIX family)
VDIIIEIADERGRPGIILIKRRDPPPGWALPGGFVDYGESLEQAAVREAREETSLDVTLKYQMHAYSDPRRDPRKHTITTVFVAAAQGTPLAQDDALEIEIVDPAGLDRPLAFDHEQIIQDYVSQKYQPALSGKQDGTG